VWSQCCDVCCATLHADDHRRQLFDGPGECPLMSSRQYARPHSRGWRSSSSTDKDRAVLSASVVVAVFKHLSEMNVHPSGSKTAASALEYSL
jgi:hypothetical protein